MSPQISDILPIPIQIKFLYISSGYVLTALPPNLTNKIWIPNVKNIITRNNGLLKKPLNTLNSPNSIFLAFIRLKSYKKTNT